MKVIPLKNEIHYRTNFDTFIWKFKSMSSALFSEWEYTQQLQTKINEERKEGAISLPRAIYRDVLQLADIGIFKEFKKLGRTGYFLAKKAKTDSNFAFF